MNLSNITVTLFALGLTAPLWADDRAEFFEKKIRPILVERCEKCHSAAQQKTKGGLALDTRAGWEKGGESGAALVPGKPDESLLLRAVSYADEDLLMPPKKEGGKLSEPEIAALRQWVSDGAHDPRVATGAAAESLLPWPEKLAQRREWWSLQPIKVPPVPAGRGSVIDRFLSAKLAGQNLSPAPRADDATLARRLAFVLTGLPAESEAAPSQLVEELLASPRFGEHWARHWMDLVRYADSHGSEGDPAIPEAWRYRDYLIRALNADVPLDQLIREHVAGDLLPVPRRGPDGMNESAIGPAHFRLCEHGFQPVDTLDEQVKTVDSQIDVLSKAFLGLTVSCARCHDHKFDAISQRDYTALTGVLMSVRPIQRVVSEVEPQPALAEARRRLRDELARRWQEKIATLPGRLMPTDGSARLEFPQAEKNPANPWHGWLELRDRPDGEFAIHANDFAGRMTRLAEEARVFNRQFKPAWNLAVADDRAKWALTGPGPVAVGAGAFAVEPEGARIFTGLLPAGLATHTVSQRWGGVATSPRFLLESDFVSVRVLGGKGAAARVVVNGYPLPQNPTFPKAELKSDEPRWVRLDTAYRRGGWAYVELATAPDLTREVGGQRGRNGESFFAAAEVVFHDTKDTPREMPVVPEGATAKSKSELAAQYAERLREAVTAWREERMTERQRVLLDATVRAGFLSTEMLPQAEEVRALAEKITTPERVPGVLEGTPVAAPFLPRGDHRKPAAEVPRGWLEVLGGQKFPETQSGRLELARMLTGRENPLTARVMVNRVWQQMFGQGLVGTPDNFGKLGELPSHPELLDWLAVDFAANGWSLKRLIRQIVATDAWQRASVAASASDPANRLLAHYSLRRISAESLRDAMLKLSGTLESRMFGAGDDARAKATEQRRRSVYLLVRRNALSPFLETFDSPPPFATKGRRDATNVPAQALALLNDPLVIHCAREWSRRVCASVPETDARLELMWKSALGRSISPEELADCRAVLGATPDGQAWQDMAQSVFNLKEFLYLR